MVSFWVILISREYDTQMYRLGFSRRIYSLAFFDRESVNNNIQRLLESGTVDRDVSYGSQSSQSDADDEKAI